MNVENKYAMIFHNENNGVMYYSISDSTKQLDGTYANKSYGARFKKDTEPPTDRSKINFKGFTSNYQADKDSPVYATIQVMEWEYSEQKETQYNTLSDDTIELANKFKDKIKEERKEEPFFASSNIEVDDDDLPFD
jgi:hypothetical protein